MSNILVIDDKLDVCLLLKTMLVKEGHTVSIAESAVQGLEQLSLSKFDLILLDIKMPEIDGFRFLEMARISPPETVAVVISGINDPETARRALDMGVYGYVLKPFVRNEILINVANALSRRQLEIENARYQYELEELVQEKVDALTQSEKRYRNLVEMANSIILRVDAEGRVRFVNRFGQAFFQFDEQELIGKHILGTIVPKADSKGGDLTAMLKEVFERPEDYKVNENENVKKDGTRVWVSWTNKPIFDHKGNLVELLTIGNDITARIQALEKLRESERILKSITMAAQDAIIMVDTDGLVSFWNRAAEEIFGYKAKEALGWDVHDLLAPETYAEKYLKGRRIFKNSGAGKAIGRTIELRAKKNDGAELPVELSLSAIREKNGWHAVALVRDISERIRLEAQLIQAQKLESIGQLAAGIAHEINTPVQYITDNATFLKEAFADILKLVSGCKMMKTLGPGRESWESHIASLEEVASEIDLPYLEEEIPLSLEQSLEGLSRVTQIVRAMKEFSHPGLGEKTAVDINRSIENTVTVCRNEWKYTSEVVLDLSPDLPPVMGLSNEINQVLLNIVVNSAQANAEMIPDGTEGKGTITITSRSVGDQVEIRIKDTGPGIKPELRHRIFDPFFTTKGVGRGTGQGLAIARSVIVDKHGGALEIDPDSGAGAVFIIRLPLGEKEAGR